MVLKIFGVRACYAELKYFDISVCTNFVYLYFLVFFWASEDGSPLPSLGTLILRPHGVFLRLGGS